MKINRTDLLWNYAASFMRVASALVVLPLILKMLPSEEMGLWTVMISLNSMIYLLDLKGSMLSLQSYVKIRVLIGLPLNRGRVFLVGKLRPLV